jgi:outer membrane protein OmpA-like peptidoglycan-associated protein
VSRSPRSTVAAVAAAAGLGLAATAGAGAQAPSRAARGEVRTLVLTVRDLDLTVSSLDNSVQRTDSSSRVRFRLAADVLFAFNRARLEPAATARIDQAVAAIRQRKPRVVAVDGYTDSKGTQAYNLGLSRRRAQAVEGALRSALGAQAPPLVVAGHGEADPVAQNTKPDGTDNPKGRALNRRVEISFPKR